MRFPPLPYLTLCLSLPLTQLAAQGGKVESPPYPTVTDERLQHPEAGDWLMYRRTYDGSGFSPLRQITTSNVGKLSLAWSLNTDLIEAHETTPIVNHGRMFITTPSNNVIALDARTVAVTAGWGLDAQGVQNGIDKIRGTTTVVPKGGTVLVFKLRRGRAPVEFRSNSWITMTWKADRECRSTPRAVGSYVGLVVLALCQRDWR